MVVWLGVHGQMQSRLVHHDRCWIVATSCEHRRGGGWLGEGGNIWPWPGVPHSEGERLAGEGGRSRWSADYRVAGEVQVCSEVINMNVLGWCWYGDARDVGWEGERWGSHRNVGIKMSSGLETVKNCSCTSKV